MGFQYLKPTAIDTLPVDKAKQVLSDLARIDTPLLSMLGSDLSPVKVFVVDTIDAVGAGSEDDCLRAYAGYSGLHISDPVPVIAIGSWEVHMRVGDSLPQKLSSGLNYDECLQNMRVTLHELAGDRVLDLHAWQKLQESDSFVSLILAETVPVKQKLSPFVQIERKVLEYLPVSSDFGDKLFQTPAKKRRKQAYLNLKEPQGLGKKVLVSSESPWNIEILLDDGVMYANHHDLIGALRLGLNIVGLEPWPLDVAHEFLIQEELRATMRSRGYVQLVDYDPKTQVHLRSSLPEFTEDVTGEKVVLETKKQMVEKTPWPPSSLQNQSIVIILNRARLALSEEPEWEIVCMRDIIQCCGHFWIEIGDYFQKNQRK